MVRFVVWRVWIMFVAKLKFHKKIDMFYSRLVELSYHTKISQRRLKPCLITLYNSMKI